MVPVDGVQVPYRRARKTCDEGEDGVALNSYAMVVLLMFCGVLIRRTGRFPEGTAQVLNLFALYLSLPALVVLKARELGISREVLLPALVPWALLIALAALVLVASRASGWSKEVEGCLMLTAPLGNTSFLGVPMVRAFLGEGAIPYALVYDQIGSFLALATYGSLVLALYGPGEGRPTLRSVLEKVLTFPPFLALTLSLSTRSLELPSILRESLSALALTLVPVVMVAVGYGLTLRMESSYLRPMAIGLSLKMFLSPLLALAICLALGVKGEAARVSVMEAAMPPMVSAGALASLAGLSPRLSSAMVGLGIPLSFATLPLVHRVASHFL